VLKAVKSVVSTLAALRAAVISTAKQVPRRQLAAITATIVILVAVLLLVPRPGAMQLRDWATSLGAWFPLAFLAVHIVVTVFPFPRTAFTLASGLLFGPWLGIGIAVVASTISALLALLLVRAAGWRLHRLVPHPRVKTLDARLRKRGWPTIVSMRLIPAVPFSVLNYAAGASAVRVMPYTLATLAGLRPHQPAADPGIALHGESRCGGPDLRDPRLSQPPFGQARRPASRRACDQSLTALTAPRFHCRCACPPAAEVAEVDAAAAPAAAAAAVCFGSTARAS